MSCRYCDYKVFNEPISNCNCKSSKCISNFVRCRECYDITSYPIQQKYDNGRLLKWCCSSCIFKSGYVLPLNKSFTTFEQELWTSEECPPFMYYDEFKLVQNEPSARKEVENKLIKKHKLNNDDIEFSITYKNYKPTREEVDQVLKKDGKLPSTRQRKLYKEVVMSISDYYKGTNYLTQSTR